MKRVKSLIMSVMVLGMLSAGTGSATAATYNVDPSHTLLGFTVRHLMISNVNGRFHVYKGQVEIDEQTKELQSVEAIINASSIDTDNDKRDGHLKSPDFFNVGQFPEITFKSTTIEKVRGVYHVTGDLTIKGVTKSVTLKGNLTGLVDAGMFGGKRAGFWATGLIDRRDFGLTWNKNLDRGGVVVGDKIKIKLEIEATRAS
jgi:polyisoprenoid-binding protein YceI